MPVPLICNIKCIIIYVTLLTHSMPLYFVNKTRYRDTWAIVSDVWTAETLHIRWCIQNTNLYLFKKVPIIYTCIYRIYSAAFPHISLVQKTCLHSYYTENNTIQWYFIAQNPMQFFDIIMEMRFHFIDEVHISVHFLCRIPYNEIASCICLLDISFGIVHVSLNWRISEAIDSCWQIRER